MFSLVTFCYRSRGRTGWGDTAAPGATHISRRPAGTCFPSGDARSLTMHRFLRRLVARAEEPHGFSSVAACMGVGR